MADYRDDARDHPGDHVDDDRPERDTGRPWLSRRTPAGIVGLVLLAVIVVVLLVFWLVTSLEGGDPTNHLEEHQPSPSATSPS